jgi:hypothetical protein
MFQGQMDVESEDSAVAGPNTSLLSELVTILVVSFLVFDRFVSQDSK